MSKSVSSSDRGAVGNFTQGWHKNSNLTKYLNLSTQRQDQSGSNSK